MATTVFYSWQSDSTPRKTTRDFIRDAADAALKRIANGMMLDDAPRLDQDTAGVSGTPAIGETILRKIDRCAIFLADVSLVGETVATAKNKKRMPNPNVMFELGYAAGRIGWNRIVLSMNTLYGAEAELPFDLRFRRFPLGYRIADDRNDIDERREKLSTDLEMAFQSSLLEEHQAVKDIVKKLGGHTLHFMKLHATNDFFWEKNVGQGSLLGHVDHAILRLLELEVIESAPYSNEHGVAYRWTYFGRLCLRTLGHRVPLIDTYPTEVTGSSFSANASPQIVTNAESYDAFLDNHESQNVVTNTEFYDSILNSGREASKPDR